MKYTYVISILLIGLLFTPCIAETIHPESAGYISVISSPSGATVIYDGTKSGVTPVILTIYGTDTPPHTIILQKSGYQDWTTSINQNPEQGTVETISATLNQVADSGTISVTSEPTGADVTCDGTDSRITPYTYEGVSPGVHNIRLSKDGYVPYTTTITVASGAESVVSAALNHDTEVKSGSITVTSIPTGATITLDGSQAKKTPTTYSGVPAGTYQMEISKEGYVTDTRTITVTNGLGTPVSVELSPIKKTTSLTVNSNPSGATIYLNGIYYGVTPAYLDDITPGIYTIKAEKSLYNTDTEIVNLVSGKESTVQLSLTLKIPDRPFWNYQVGIPFDMPFGGDIPINMGPGGPTGGPPGGR